MCGVNMFILYHILIICKYKLYTVDIFPARYIILLGHSPILHTKQGEIMSDKNTVTYSSKVMADGQVTIPKDIREILGVTSGDSITFIADSNSVRIVNSAIYAMQVLQNEMTDEDKRSGLCSEDDVTALVSELRNGK